MPPALSAEEIRDVNTRYHDVAASHYDSKWGIDFGEIGREQVLAKVDKALGHRPDGWARSLEIGAGTGYFTLNLLRAGLIGEATCSDISPGMLATLRANAERLGLEVRTEQVDAERLPFADESFDLVLGHAVLHHIPDLDRAFAEFERVLAPGGTRAVRRRALALRRPPRARAQARRRRARAAVAPRDRRARRAPRRRRASPTRRSRASSTCTPSPPASCARAARAAGLADVRVTGEELLANWFGWTNRTLEATAEPDDVPWAWRQYAYRGYLVLQGLDRRLLESRLPPAIFYNLMLSARKPRNA